MRGKWREEGTRNGDGVGESKREGRRWGGGRRERERKREERREYSDSDIQLPIKCKILHCLIIFDGV